VTSPIRVEGAASPESSNPFDLAASVSFVTSEYFAATGMRLASGRGFDAKEGHADSAVVVNEAFVKRFIQGMPPLGSG